MGDTFDFPGVATQAMLPPQPSRTCSQGQRTSSIGQPLQQMDSNQNVPYTGKGKGRARDFDSNQQPVSTGWDQTTVAEFGQLSVPYVEDVQSFPPQSQNVGPGTFTFSQEHFTTWQPAHPDYAQPNLQQVNFNPLAREFQPAQPQAHPHAHPHPVQAGPAPPIQQLSQIPLQQLYQPPPPVPQHPQSPGIFHPENQPPPQQQHWLGLPPALINVPPVNPQHQQQQQLLLPPTPLRVGVGYRFRPGLGFVCQACGTVMAQPNMHFIVVGGQGRWCEAAGIEMAEHLRALQDATPRRISRGG